MAYESSMSLKEIRDTLYFHMAGLELDYPGSWDQGIWQVKEALRIVIESLDRNMARPRADDAK